MSATNQRPSTKQLKENFADLHPPLSAQEAMAEASRCLYCYDAPCTRACPTHIDIPGFIRQILHQNPVGAASTILDENIFGGSCARVCPTEVLCEGACVDQTLLKAPVQIGRLQRFACDHAHEKSMAFYRPGEPTGRRVAIVGGGPAGLTCGHELRKRGHEVTVFEARNVAGGLNTLGIAAYKMSTEFAMTEVDRVTRMGIDLKLKNPVDGRKLAQLLDEFDAVLLAVGLGSTAPLHIPGEHLDGVWESLEFLFQPHTKSLGRCQVGERVVVIGGGNTAIDAANTARLLGAKQVTIAYRRSDKAMPAFAHEAELAKSNGIRFEWNVAPLKIMGKGGVVTGVRLARTQSKGKGRGASLEIEEGSEFTMPADMVIKALGQEVLHDLLSSIAGLKLDKKGRIAVDATTRATSVPKLFAGGDCEAKAKEEVVYAVQAGKIAARGIHDFLLTESLS